MDYEEIIDYLIDEKMGYEKYKKLAMCMDNEAYKEMFLKIAEDENNHFKMIKEYLSRMMPKG